MKSQTGIIIKWAANILGGLIAAFFLFMFFGEFITSMVNNSWISLRTTEIILFVFIGIAIAGLFLSYFRRLYGAVLAIIGSGMFIIMESIGRGALFPFSDGIFFYIILLAGILHLCAFIFLNNKTRHKIAG